MRGATFTYYRSIIPRQISIHAPMRGATKEISGAAIVFKISIHAPMRGATRRSYLYGKIEIIFQSTRP